MAFPNQIEMASKTEKAPVGVDKIQAESALLSMPRLREDEERKEQRRAARYIIRKGGGDRDLLLDIIGRTYAEAAPEPVPGWSAEVPAEPTVDEKRCSRCGEVKPLDQFPSRGDATDRRMSHCRECKAGYHRARRLAVKQAGQLNPNGEVAK